MVPAVIAFFEGHLIIFSHLYWVRYLDNHSFLMAFYQGKHLNLSVAGIGTILLAEYIIQ